MVPRIKIYDKKPRKSQTLNWEWIQAMKIKWVEIHKKNDRKTSQTNRPELVYLSWAKVEPSPMPREVESLE